MDLDSRTDNLMRNFVVGHRTASEKEFNTEGTEDTEKEKRSLRDGDFFVGAEHVAERGQADGGGFGDPEHGAVHRLQLVALQIQFQ